MKMHAAQQANTATSSERGTAATHSWARSRVCTLQANCAKQHRQQKRFVAENAKSVQAVQEAMRNLGYPRYLAAGRWKAMSF